MTNKILNTSGWRPAGRAVLVLPDIITETKSTIIIPKTVTDRTKMMQDRATVIAVGPEAWAEEREGRAVPGDKVILAAFAGYILMGEDGKEYRFVNERDIFAVRAENENG
jgi:co-chaperonin GroES (HSP10)